MLWQVRKAVRGKEGVSLSLMAEACLGQPLDKSMQLSSWASRPLSQRQLTYAGELWRLCNACSIKDQDQSGLLGMKMHSPSYEQGFSHQAAPPCEVGLPLCSLCS